MKTIQLALREAAKPGFWGQIQIDYQDGQPVLIRKTETTKLEGNNPDYDRPRK